MKSKLITVRRIIGIILAVVLIWFVVIILIQTNWDKTYDMGEMVSMSVEKGKELVICIESNGSIGYSKKVSNENDLKHIKLTEITYMPVYPIFFEGIAGKGGYKKIHFTGQTVGVDTVKILGKIHGDVEAHDSSLFIVTVVE